MNKPPTSRQLSYLKSLANRTGTTFTYPVTAAQASYAIQEMEARLRNTDQFIEGDRARRERRSLAYEASTGLVSSAQVRDHEITGYGSSATWA